VPFIHLSAAPGTMLGEIEGLYLVGHTVERALLS